MAVKSIELLEFDLTTSETTETRNLSKSQTAANCVPFSTARMGAGSSDQWRYKLLDVAQTTSPDGFSITRNAAAGTAYRNLYVVEFDSAKVKVQTGTFSLTTTQNVSLTTSVTRANAFVIHYWQSTDGTDDYNDNTVRATIATDGASIDFTVQGSSGTKSGHWWVVEAIGATPAFTVQHVAQSFSTSTTTVNTAITTVDPDKSFLVTSWQTSESSDDPRDGSIATDITTNVTAGDQITSYRGNGSTPSASLDANVQVVEFNSAGSQTVQRGMHSWIGTASGPTSIAITEVDLANSIVFGSCMDGRGEGNSTSPSGAVSSFTAMHLTDSTHIEVQRLPTTGVGAVDTFWQVIDWTSGFSLSTEEFDDKDTGIVLTGDSFGATQGTGTVEISDNAVYATGTKVAQTVTAWADTSITITAVIGTHTPGTLYMWMTPNTGDRQGPVEVTLHRAVAFTMALSDNIAPQNTAQILTGQTGTFGGGRWEEALNPSTTLTNVALDGHREDEINVVSTADANAAQYRVRQLWGGLPADTITQTPLITITAGAAGQTLTGTLYSDADTFGTSSLTLGAVSVTGTLYSDSDFFGASTLTTSIDLTGTLYADPDSFGTHALSTIVSITGTLYADPDIFGSHAVTTGTVGLTGTLFEDADTFGSHSLSLGAVSLTGTLYSDADSFGASTIVAGGSGLVGQLYSDPDTFGASSITVGSVSITGTLYEDADTFGSHTINQAGGPQTIIGSAYLDADSFGASAIVAGEVTIAGTVYLDPDLFPGGTISLAGLLAVQPPISVSIGSTMRIGI